MALGQWLLTADIDHRACQMPFLERLDQVAIDHRHPAPGVDEQRAGLEALEQRSVVQIMGRRCIGQQVKHIVRLFDHAR
ncbi:hypothetical protein D3C76_1522360 [compost metagenome]